VRRQKGRQLRSHISHFPSRRLVAYLLPGSSTHPSTSPHQQYINHNNPKPFPKQINTTRSRCPTWVHFLSSKLDADLTDLGVWIPYVETILTGCGGLAPFWGVACDWSNAFRLVAWPAGCRADYLFLGEGEKGKGLIKAAMVGGSIRGGRRVSFLFLLTRRGIEGFGIVRVVVRAWEDMVRAW